jgi:putative tricarboxylic transport membrane protein
VRKRSPSPRRPWRLCGFVGVIAALVALSAHAAAPGPARLGRPTDQLTLYVPAPEGGGWEQTAIAMKAALEAEGLARDVAIEHHPGAGGLVGLTQFIETRRGDPHSLIVGGVGMIHSAKVNASAVTPLSATPIARLTRDYYMVAVPAASPLHSVRDLLATLKARPGALHWTGDQPGGAAEELAWRIAASAHVAPLSLPYLPRFGSREVANALEQGDPSLVAVAGLGELAPARANGGIRVLAVAAPGASYAGEPTLRVQGLDIVAANWRGVFAPPGIRPEQRQRLIRMLAVMARSEVWRDSLRRRGWEDAFLSGDAFSAFVADEQQRVFAITAPYREAPDPESPGQAWLWPTVAAGTAALLAAAGGFAALRFRRAYRRAAKVRETLAPIEVPPPSQPSPVVAAINQEFDAWKLSAAERDVAWFLLKGLPMKEIGRLRGASERTVRQQARAVYGKAELDGRSDLAAHILDRCLAPAGQAGQA